MSNRLFTGTTLSLLLAIAPSIITINSNYAYAEESSIETAKKLSEAFEKAAGVITPAVVNISATKKVKGFKHGMKRNDPFFDQFRDFFGDEIPGFGGQEDGNDGPSQQGLGTGVVVDSNKGYILTNNHVVGEADTLEVRLNDGRKFKAELVGKDDRSDLAVIRIKASGLTAAKLGNSDNLKIGEWVVAAGNPFGLDNSITAGIISAKGRSLVGGAQYEDFIQTDAAINPGNSGGPLVNLEGEVVGINTAIFSRSGGYMGIGFAIPSNMARGVMESLISSGKVVRGWLGVGIQNLTEDLAKSFNYSGTDGALVGHVEPEGPADKAGLNQGDIIVSLNGEKLKDINQLRNKIAAIKPGTSVTLETLREGESKTVSVKVGELPTQLGSSKSNDSSEEEDDNAAIGISVEELTPELAQRLGAHRKAGVVIRGVKPGSIAQQSGLQPGDIIVTINGKAVKSTTELRASLKKTDTAKGLRLVVESQGMERFVFLKSE